MDERRIFSIQEVEAALRLVLPAEEAREVAGGMYASVPIDADIVNELLDDATPAGHTMIEGKISFTRPGHKYFRNEDLGESCVLEDTMLDLLRLVSADTARRVQLLRDESTEEAMRKQEAVALWLAERTKSSK